MNEPQSIMPVISSRPAAERVAPLFAEADFAAEEIKMSRRAVCDLCSLNQRGRCMACCAGVPIETKIGLTVSRCPEKKWIL
jgi:hypothetical protein